METCFRNFSIQWKHVSGTFHTMETCFAQVFHGVEKGGGSAMFPAGRIGKGFAGEGGGVVRS
jgi:hypothetical protein